MTTTWTQHASKTSPGLARSVNTHMTKTNGKKPAKKPSGLMDLHTRLYGGADGVEEPDAVALRAFADAVVRACDAPAVEMRRRVFRAVETPTYEVMLESQVIARRGDRGPGDLEQLLHSSDTWTVEP